MKTVNVRDSVIYISPTRTEHPALVTAVHGMPDKTPAINVLYVSPDSAKIDPYGRQVERFSSVAHISNNSARANCWKFVDE